MNEDEKNMDFAHMNIGDVEALVGRKADNVELRGSWVYCFFAGSNGISDVSVSFKKW